ncbi:hypothetical protein EIP91_007408 [Steccherinum ochraceum]|uniref:7alpha-cephem-methoxylase P8 chain n=1 Tax=Steccherinum ochraceum TaxID=92696 RepID=A0A4R0RS44_9APHY|nr:hypothetical protein EIP91_007408 [Steccherinum ochraceum]
MTVSSKEPASVKGQLVYFVAPSDGSKPWSDINADIQSESEGRNWSKTNHYFDIENLRGKEDSVSLDVNGFQFYKVPATHQKFDNDADIEKEYYPESIELVKKLTGATRAVVFDHTIRRRRPGELDNGPTKRQPVPLVHVDQTPQSAAARVHRHTSAEDAPKLLQKRFQIINLWRPISVPAYDWPLALCDWSSIDYKRELIPTTLKYPDRDGETFSVAYNASHRWNYVRGMTPEELVLIKCYDSQEDGKTSLLTAHTAFEDPSTPAGSPLRQSIELRLLVFYD